MASVKMPTMDWGYTPLRDALKVFKARINLYFEDANITEDKKKAIKIKIASGDEGMRRIMNSGMTTTEQDIPERIWELLESEVDAAVKVSFRVHRLEFNNIRQNPDETTQQFISRLREKAHKCNFNQEELSERIIEMVILSTPHEDLRKTLLTTEKGFKVSDVIEKAREYEAILASKDMLQAININKQEKENQTVDAIRKKSNNFGYGTTKRRKCFNCGLNHPPRSCPAFKDKCHNCGKPGHWAKLCRSRIPEEGRKMKQHELALDEDENEEITTVFHSLNISNMETNEKDNKNSNEAFIQLDILHENETKKIRLKIDTGAAGNTLPLRTLNQMYPKGNGKIQPEQNIKLTSYSGNEIKCLGSILLNIKKSNQHQFAKEKFYIVDVSGPAILGLPTSRKLDIVNINIESLKYEETPITSVNQLKEMFPSQFDRVGKVKEPAKLYLKEDAVPHCDAPRKVSIHLKPKIKHQLKEMENQDIIRKLDVNEHSDWCSSLVYVTKDDGNLRICLDPKKLNKSLKRVPHKIPTTEEINPIFAEATVFSKLDAKAGYWNIPLDEDSQLLTTFRTPFGRYCWKRLPFGLNVSQDIFQARMDILTEGLEGVANIADDLAIAGKNQKDHDKKLIKLMKRAADTNICFNSVKCDVSKPEISFFGNHYSEEGIKPDPKKLIDLKNMASPANKEELSKILGLLTYLSSYIPNFSAKSEPLRALLKKDVPFIWEPEQEQYLNKLKSEITNKTTLPFYNPKVPLTIEVDASTKGLGAALIQNEKPIAFASKALTKTQANYSNIEREALGLVHGVQRYHTYLYGKSFNAFTDHKPLVDIWEKPLICAPQRLQRLFLLLQGYNMKLQYRPGPEMTLSDTLSRLPNMENKSTIQLDARVDGVCVQERELDALPITLLNFTQERLNKIQKETAEDPKLNILTQTILQGWPEDIKQCNQDIREYFNFRECLAIENGIIFKGRQVIIPEISRKDILKQLHTSHQGINKTQMLARESVYWPGINKEIETMTRNCETCQKYMPQQSAEPALHHNIPPAPWMKIGSDLYQIGNTHFLIIIDYFSKYPIVAELGSTTSQNIIKTFKTTFSMFGSPREIVSDNGPQFSSAEFKMFTNRWGIKHNPSSPYYPKSNGLAERTVQTVKKIIKKCKETSTDISEALLHLRATPVDSQTKSPAELMFGRPIPTILPSRLEPSSTDVDTRNHFVARLRNTPGKELSQLTPGQSVRILDRNTKMWMPAKVINQNKQPRSYTISTNKDTQIIRNRVDIREIPQKNQKQYQATWPKDNHKVMNSTPREPLVIQEPNQADTTQSETEEANHPQQKTQQSEPESQMSKTNEKNSQNQSSQPDNVTKQITTRSGRIITKPKRFNELSQ